MDILNEMAQYEATAAKYQALANKYKEKARETKIKSYQQAIKDSTLELPYKVTQGLSYREYRMEDDITDNLHAVASDLGIEDFDAILPTKEPTTDAQKKFVTGIMKVAMNKGYVEYEKASKLTKEQIALGLIALDEDTSIIEEVLEGLE